MDIVVMGGSFNPPTVAHLRLMLAALDATGADRGIFVPSNHAYVSAKMRKLERPKEEILPEHLRLEMLLAMAADDERLAVDDMEFGCSGIKYTYDTMLDLQQKYQGATIYFLAGNDKLSVIPRWRNAEKLVEGFRVIVCRRDDEDPEEIMSEHPFFAQRRDRFFVIDAPDGIDNVSSTAVRAMLTQNDGRAREMCHPEVFRILNEFKNAVCGFRGEYRFLSNFWEAPVEYGGLTYLNNEAAFQAQKCLDDEEKRPFTLMAASKAKSAGKRVSLRPDWERVKVGIMEELVRAKFTQNEELRRLLLATGDRRLEEANTWHDTFWGVDINTRNGKNHLGRILMKVRSELS